MEPFKGEIDLKENLDIPNKNHPTNLGKIKCGLITIVIFLILLLIVIIYLSFYDFETPNQDKNDTSDINKEAGAINSIYTIGNLYSPLLSSEFKNINNTVLSIYINGTKINYTKDYEFNSTGIYNIKFVLNSVANLDNMFKNVYSIKSIESIDKYSDSSLTILSMKSTFEGCPFLQKVSIQNSFDTSKLKSTSKLFYKSNVEIIDLKGFDTKNVEDMSYMFSTTFINNTDFLKGLDTSNVIYMTGMFKDCFYLEDVNIANLNTKNVIDISYMFENCGYLKKINLNNFNGNEIP